MATPMVASGLITLAAITSTAQSATDDMSPVTTPSVSQTIAGFFAELQRRRVLHIGGVYIAGAWLGAEIISFLLEQSMAPAWSFRLLAIVFVVGFPVSVVLAWVVQIQPDGSWAIDPSGGQRRTIVAAITLGLLATAGLSWLILPGRQQSPPLPSYQPLPNSVAVLAFADMSPSKDQEYFADGLSDTLIHVLAQVSGLKVTAKTSSFYFKGKNIDVSEIARELNVSTILEGSVQKAGNQVRVIAQLINAGDGTHLWSKSFDRDLEDIFAVQDEIAKEVVQALQVTLLDTEEERFAQRYQPTWEAYEQLILGLHEMANATGNSLIAAEQHFKQAIKSDPGYALPYAYLSETYGRQVTEGSLVFEESLQRRQPLIDKALELDPLSGEAHIERAFFHSHQQIKTGEDNSNAVEEDILKALELSPNYAVAHQQYSDLLNRQGRIVDALVQIRLAAELDPMSARIQLGVARITWNAGRAEKALTLIRRNIERNPELPGNYESMAIYEALLGQVGEAQLWIQEALRRDPGDAYIWIRKCKGLLSLGDVLSAQDCASQLSEAYPEKIVSRAMWFILPQYQHEWNAAIAVLEPLSERVPGFLPYHWLLADLAARQGNVEQARTLMASVFPKYLEDGLELTAVELPAALVFAAILHANGEIQRRDVLLLAMEERIATLHRIRGRGYGVTDVYIHVMRGDHDLAIAALQEAVDIGWRTSTNLRMGSWWTLRQDWKLGSLLQDPEFITLMNELEADINTQRQWYEENKDKPLF